MKDITIVSNPLIDHYLGVIRDEQTGKNDFGQAIESIVYLMSSNITGNIGTATKTVKTPLAETSVAYFFDKILVIPILRAGLAMFEPVKRIIPSATFGYVGIKRSHASAVKDITADMYYCNLPNNLHEYKVILLDVVVATGVSTSHCVDYLIERGVKEENITLASLICSREGVNKVNAAYPKMEIFTCAIDEVLTDNGYIVPGLGDAGDRYNGY
ncbi:MAG: uracil phosphoribosyltransferase [Defluviitaleaceae bacterium]|nr:uracil phosphoribosyltransferase [Defluviitaleaceae bacterium]